MGCNAATFTVTSHGVTEARSLIKDFSVSPCLRGLWQQ